VAEMSQMRTEAGKIAVCWTGNAGWLMGCGELQIGVDLDL